MDIDYSLHDGVIFVGTELEKEDYQKLDRIKLPMVVLDNPMVGTGFNSVGIDNTESTRLAVEYCRTCGYERIGYLRSSFDTGNFEERAEAFYRYSAEYGLKCEGIAENGFRQITNSKKPITAVTPSADGIFVISLGNSQKATFTNMKCIVFSPACTKDLLLALHSIT